MWKRLKGMMRCVLWHDWGEWQDWVNTIQIKRCKDCRKKKVRTMQ